MPLQHSPFSNPVQGMRRWKLDCRHLNLAGSFGKRRTLQACTHANTCSRDCTVRVQNRVWAHWPAISKCARRAIVIWRLLAAHETRALPVLSGLNTHSTYDRAFHELTQGVHLRVKEIAAGQKAIQVFSEGTLPSLLDTMTKLAHQGRGRPDRLLTLAMLLAHAGRSPSFQSLAARVTEPTCNATSPHASFSISSGNGQAHQGPPITAGLPLPGAGTAASKNCPTQALDAPAALARCASQADNGSPAQTLVDGEGGPSASSGSPNCNDCVQKYVAALAALGDACAASAGLPLVARSSLARVEACLLDAAQCLPVDVLVQANSRPQAAEQPKLDLPEATNLYTADFLENFEAVVPDSNVSDANSMSKA